MNPAISQHQFGTLANDTPVMAYSLKNAHGLEIEILNYGGIIRKLKLPDRNGVLANCVLGFDNLEDYISKSPYFGALIGRYANRIAKGRFSLNGTSYTLEKNHGNHHLHGGIKGFDKVIWEVKEVSTQKGVGLDLTYVSPHMEEGYPGRLTTKVSYLLTHQNTLEVAYIATTDRPTVINLTQHSYFNLSGNLQQDCLDHELTIRANHFLAVNNEMIPTGEKVTVEKTPFNFRTSQILGNVLGHKHEQLQLGSGFDHCYCFDSVANQLKKVATLFHPQSGRKMQVHTTSPGMQLYTANHLDAPFVPFGAVCLETQAYPDSPNQSKFPSTILRPEETFKSSTHFHFSID